MPPGFDGGIHPPKAVVEEEPVEAAPVKTGVLSGVAPRPSQGQKTSVPRRAQVAPRVNVDDDIDVPTFLRDSVRRTPRQD